MRNLRSAWNELADTLVDTVRAAQGEAIDSALPDAAADRVRDQMRECLAGTGGEVSARARAAALGRAYLSLDPGGRERFLRILAVEFDCDRATVDAAVAQLNTATEPDERRRAEARLRRALDPPRRRLLTQFNALPEGVKFLVDMRAELLELSADDPSLAALESDLKGLLAAWFDIGFLELKRIGWDSPAAVLEKLIEYEAVHEIRGWDDLRNRLDSDRRCFAFFHPRMPDEPLIFVEVALTDGLAGNIQALLDPHAPLGDPRKANTAIFYSISNAQKGLGGISFGGFLIKRVVDELASEFDRLTSFATLSPIPGFRHWLARQWSVDETQILTPVERRALADAAGVESGALAALLAREDWHRDPALSEVLRRPVMRLCARYLMQDKRDDGRAIDPVANFHLANGARMERLNWLADTARKGIAQSAGLMINYLYKVEDIPSNHEAYVGNGEIPASAAMRALIKS